MPFYQDATDDNAQILIWKYDENVDQFDHNTLIEEENRDKIENYHHKKLAEYLMIRQLMKRIYPDHHKILYKKIGQPYLFPQDAYISISHSYPFAALAISQKRVGIDLEKIQDKILKVKHKFLYSTESSWTENENEVDFLTIIWAVKEALYKLHPCKYWSLKKHYELMPFNLNDLSRIECRVFDDEFEDAYVAKVSKIENYYFAIIEENHQLNYKIRQKQL